MKDFYLKVSGGDKGLRLDQCIIMKLKHSQCFGQSGHAQDEHSFKLQDGVISRSQIQRLINAGRITVNQEPTKAHYKVKEDDLITINIPRLQTPKALPERIPLKIIFEDKDILIINKPAGMVTHPALGNYSHTLVNALLNYGCPLSAVNGPFRPGIVHRLDKDTSGLMVVAKNDFAYCKLAQQFQAHTVQRKYLAIVKGKPAHNAGVIELPISRHPQNRQKMVVSFTKSRYALTRYKVLKSYKHASLLELAPHTGRTHQLRVHLKFSGHPILGDRRYGRTADLNHIFAGEDVAFIGKEAGANPMLLHATALGFCHPRTKEFVEFKSEPPQYFKQALKALEEQPEFKTK